MELTVSIASGCGSGELMVHEQVERCGRDAHGEWKGPVRFAVDLDVHGFRWIERGTPANQAVVGWKSVRRAGRG